MFELPKLKYAFEALEPYMDRETVEIHHNKHHRAYMDKLNGALKGTQYEAYNTDAQLSELISNLDNLDASIKGSVRNAGGGYLNHNLFFSLLRSQASETINNTDFLKVVESQYGSAKNFLAKLKECALNHFGSGWAWVVVENKKLNIYSLTNQDSPLSQGHSPILLLDVWEHAYYLKYQNRRPEFIDNLIKIIDWDEVNNLYNQV